MQVRERSATSWSFRFLAQLSLVQLSVAISLPSGDLWRSMPRDPIVKRFGKRLHALRVQRDMSQEDLAAKADVHFTYISLLERGLRDPKLSSMVKMSRALGISLSDLVESLD